MWQLTIRQFENAEMRKLQDYFNSAFKGGKITDRSKYFDFICAFREICGRGNSSFTQLRQSFLR